MSDPFDYYVEDSSCNSTLPGHVTRMLVLMRELDVKTQYISNNLDDCRHEVIETLYTKPLTHKPSLPKHQNLNCNIDSTTLNNIPSYVFYNPIQKNSFQNLTLPNKITSLAQNQIQLNSSKIESNLIDNKNFIQFPKNILLGTSSYIFVTESGGISFEILHKIQCLGKNSKSLIREKIALENQLLHMVRYEKEKVLHDYNKLTQNLPSKYNYLPHAYKQINLSSKYHPSSHSTNINLYDNVLYNKSQEQQKNINEIVNYAKNNKKRELHEGQNAISSQSSFKMNLTYHPTSLNLPSSKQSNSYNSYTQSNINTNQSNIIAIPKHTKEENSDGFPERQVKKHKKDKKNENWNLGVHKSINDEFFNVKNHNNFPNKADDNTINTQQRPSLQHQQVLPNNNIKNYQNHQKENPNFKFQEKNYNKFLDIENQNDPYIKNKHNEEIAIQNISQKINKKDSAFNDLLSTVQNSSTIYNNTTISYDDQSNSNAFEEDIYEDICPICLKGESETQHMMVACDACNHWFHFECVNYRATEGEETAWFCPQCILDRVVPYSVGKNSTYNN